jgi:hypothetical protein
MRRRASLGTSAAFVGPSMSWADPQMGYSRPATAVSAVGRHGVVVLAAAEARWSQTGCPSLISAEASARAFPARRWSRLEAFLLKVRAQQAVHVVALGSSMTLGKECNTPEMSATNPQPRRVESKAGRSLGQPEA